MNNKRFLKFLMINVTLFVVPTNFANEMSQEEYGKQTPGFAYWYQIDPGNSCINCSPDSEQQKITCDCIKRKFDKNAFVETSTKMVRGGITFYTDAQGKTYNSPQGSYKTTTFYELQTTTSPKGCGTLVNEGGTAYIKLNLKNNKGSLECTSCQYGLKLTDDGLCLTDQEIKARIQAGIRAKITAQQQSQPQATDETALEKILTPEVYQAYVLLYAFQVLLTKMPQDTSSWLFKIFRGSPVVFDQNTSLGLSEELAKLPLYIIPQAPPIIKFSDVGTAFLPTIAAENRHPVSPDEVAKVKDFLRRLFLSAHDLSASVLLGVAPAYLEEGLHKPFVQNIQEMAYVTQLLSGLVWNNFAKSRNLVWFSELQRILDSLSRVQNPLDRVKLTKTLLSAMHAMEQGSVPTGPSFTPGAFMPKGNIQAIPIDGKQIGQSAACPSGQIPDNLTKKCRLAMVDDILRKVGTAQQAQPTVKAQNGVCPQGMFLHRDTCVSDCWNDLNMYTSSDNKTCVSTCPSGQYKALDKCVTQCPAGTASAKDKNELVCVDTCPDSMFFKSSDGTKCVRSCGDIGETTVANSSSCAKEGCPSGTYALKRGKAPTLCVSDCGFLTHGYASTFKTSDGRCVDRCDAGELAVPDQGVCVKSCPPGTSENQYHTCVRQ